MEANYEQLKISCGQAETICLEHYGIAGKATTLPGELDFNFRIITRDKKYILKVSRPGTDEEFIRFQQGILEHLAGSTIKLTAPVICNDLTGKGLVQYEDAAGTMRMVRLYSWVEGRLWSSVNPIRDELLFSLGEREGKLSSALSGFDHPYAYREFEWDISQARWTQQYVKSFSDPQRNIIEYFSKKFSRIEARLKDFRQAVVHNDANDNNVIVSDDLASPEVVAIIDFGDAIHTAVINDLAVTIAYAAMNKPDPLKAAMAVARGYHSSYPLLEEELECLYTLVAMRLIISVTKSAINKQKEPDNEYLLISEKPAWELLKKWIGIDEAYASANFKHVCGHTAVKDLKSFRSWAIDNQASLKIMFPSVNFNSIADVDMSISSTWLENKAHYENPAYFSQKISLLKEENPEAIIAGGYGEIRPFYTSDQFCIEGNSGPEYRSMHLGVDFWLEEGTGIYAPYDGKVVILHNNYEAKDYGPTLILEHSFGKEESFFSLYGHLKKSVFEFLKPGQEVKKGERIAEIGGPHENGGWVPHLHFQLIMDLLGNNTNFPGVANPDDREIWQQICPDPGIIFDLLSESKQRYSLGDELLDYRKKHLGKSLSLSYDTPLEILRGEGAYLIDSKGRRYLDTVNNVAHVGHEHPKVIEAGRSQMAILNTNTRYLHPAINEFANKLLDTFPPELCVAHFVNSGSEANELALRMAKTFTGRKDMIAVEVGYHGNTGGCIDISSYKFDGKGGSGAPEHTHIVPLPDAYRGIHTGENCGEEYAEHVKKAVETIRAKDREVAAFICESIISCGGQIELPRDYLAKSYEYVRQAGGICIADEVQVGCGRVGSAFWGFQLHNVVPDIVTIGKPIGNGHPLSAVVCTREVAETFANGMEYFNTFGGNPVSCTIGKNVLEVVKEEGLQENALQTGNYLKSRLRELQEEFPIIGDVRGQGLFLGFELNMKDKTPLGQHAGYLANRMKDYGILMSTDGPDHNVLKIKPPIVFSKENADELIRMLKLVLNEDFMRSYE